MTGLRVGALVGAVAIAATVAMWMTKTATPSPPEVPNGTGASVAEPGNNKAPVRVRRDRQRAAQTEPPPTIVVPKGPSRGEVQRLAEAAAKFRPSKASEDFSGPIAPGHDAANLRGISKRLEAWTQAPENAAAEATFLGVDCARPPCVMALQFNADRGSGFLDRAESWLSKQDKVGKPQTFSHQLDANYSRLWTWYNPHPEASAARFQYDAWLLDRIRKEISDLPSYNPSRDSAQQ